MKGSLQIQIIGIGKWTNCPEYLKTHFGDRLSLH